METEKGTSLIVGSWSSWAAEGEAEPEPVDALGLVNVRVMRPALLWR